MASPETEVGKALASYDEMLHRMEQFANRTKATPVATGLSMVQMATVWRPRIEAEARAQAERELLVQVMNLVRKRWWDWHSNGPKGKAQAADAILGDILETFEEAVTLSVQMFFAATDPSVNPMVASLLNENKRGGTIKW